MNYNFNFDGINSAQIYQLTDERVHEIAGIHGAAIHDIVDNYKDYEWSQGEECGLAKGKVLKRLLKDMNTPEEVALTLSIVDKLTEVCLSMVAKNKILNESKFLSILKALSDGI